MSPYPPRAAKAAHTPPILVSPAMTFTVEDADDDDFWGDATTYGCALNNFLPFHLFFSFFRARNFFTLLGATFFTPFPRDL